jgi:hypothetical protein
MKYWWRWVIAGGVMLYVFAVQAATFTLTLTAAQVAAVQYAYSVAPDRAGYGTAQDWFAAQLNSLIQNYQAAANVSAVNAFCAAWTSKTQTQQQTACSNLGLPTTCTPCP